MKSLYLRLKRYPRKKFKKEMKNLKNLAVFKLLLLFILPLMLFASNGSVLEASKSAIRIITVLNNNKDMASGTAFCINTDGYFLTNAHVVDDARSIFAVKSSSKYGVKVIKKLDGVDLAILKIDNTGLKPLTFAYRENINVTDRVSSIGFPGAADRNNDLEELTTVTINSGIIGKLTKIDLAINRSHAGTLSPVVQHDAAVNHGNSGGPLVNECGQVVGINVQKGINPNRTNAQIVAGDVIQGIFYAIDVDIAKKALKDMHISFLETGKICTPGAGASMSESERKYLIIGGILLLLLAIWALVFYLQESKKKNNIDESMLSRLISRKLGKHEQREEQIGTVKDTVALLRPMNANLPVLTVNQKEMIVGRSRSAHLHLDDLQVSGKHLSLSLDTNGEVVVKDLASTNGTYIEGKKLTPHTPYILKRGERLVIGSEDVIYTL
jgi:S1-C subfamily serine protease